MRQQVLQGDGHAHRQPRLPISVARSALRAPAVNGGLNMPTSRPCGSTITAEPLWSTCDRAVGVDRPAIDQAERVGDGAELLVAAGGRDEIRAEKIDVLTQVIRRVALRIDGNEIKKHGIGQALLAEILPGLLEAGQRGRADVRTVRIAEIHDVPVTAPAIQAQRFAVGLGQLELRNRARHRYSTAFSSFGGAAAPRKRLLSQSPRPGGKRGNQDQPHGQHTRCGWCIHHDIIRAALCATRASPILAAVHHPLPARRPK